KAGDRYRMDYLPLPKLRGERSGQASGELPEPRLSFARLAVSAVLRINLFPTLPHPRQTTQRGRGLTNSSGTGRKCDKQPDILWIWDDDLGNPSSFSDGLIGHRTPDIDRIGEDGLGYSDTSREEGRGARRCLA